MTWFHDNNSNRFLQKFDKNLQNHTVSHSTAQYHDSLSRRPLTVEAQAPYHASAYRIYCGKDRIGRGFSLQELQFFPISAISPTIDSSIYHSRYISFATDSVFK